MADKTTKEGLRERLSEISKEQHGLLDEAAEKNGGLLSPDDQEKFDKLDKEWTDKNDALSRWNKADANKEQLAREEEELSRLNPRQTTPDPLDTPSDKPKDKLNPFGNFGEQLLGIHQAALSAVDGRTIPQDLMQKLAPTGSSSGVDSSGGFLVQNEYSSSLFSRMYEVGQVVSQIPSEHRIQIGDNSDGLTMNAINETSRANGSRFGGIRAYWKSEAAQMEATKPTLRQIELKLEDLTGMWYATDRLLKDSTALTGVANAAFPEEFAFVVDDSLINGDGAGKPLGLLNTNNKALVSVAKETNQAANTIEFENITKMWTRCWARSRQSAVWFINQDIETELFNMSFPVGTGGVPAFLPPGGLSSSPYSTLFGRPVIPIEHCQTLGTKGDIILADMSQYLLIEKGGVDSASSIHLRFDYNETAFRWVMRLNGQPLWNNVLTPYKGSSTVAPFVALNTRSS